MEEIAELLKGSREESGIELIEVSKDLEINETTGSFSYTPSSDVEGDVSFKYYVEYNGNKTNISYINFYVKSNSKNKVAK